MNIYNYTAPKSGEDFTTLLEHKNLLIQRIVSSDDLEDKLYLQDADEWVIVLEGSAVLEVDGQRTALHKGDTLFLPAHTPHRVLEAAQGTLWLAIHINPI